MEGIKEKEKRSIGFKILITLLILIIILITLFVIYWCRNSYSYDWNLKTTYNAGFVEKDFKLKDNSIIHYAQGPKNGAPLLMIHGQCASWKTYTACLPTLSKNYTVYVVDCYGHGQSSHNPKKYNANTMGKDLDYFIKNVIKEKTIVTGHSSGGLLAAYLGANSNEVSGVILEDPPFFSCEDNRKKDTWNYNDTSTICDKYLKQDENKDFTLYYFENSLSWTFMGKNAKKFFVNYAKNYRKDNPNDRLVVGFLPPSFMGVYDDMDTYDPKFGETFYNGEFNKNFDHATTLSNIKCPAVLIHASHKISEDGMLQGAMTESDAKKANKLIPNCYITHSNAIHAVHSLDTKNFINILNEFVEKNNLNK